MLFLPMASIWRMRRTLRRIVWLFVRVPPSQRVVMWNWPHSAAALPTISCAWRLVATKRIFLPLRTVSRRKAAAASILTSVWVRSTMWMPLRLSKM